MSSTKEYEMKVLVQQVGFLFPDYSDQDFKNPSFKENVLTLIFSWQKIIHSHSTGVHNIFDLVRNTWALLLQDDWSGIAGALKTHFVTVLKQCDEMIPPLLGINIQWLTTQITRDSWAHPVLQSLRNHDGLDFVKGMYEFCAEEQGLGLMSRIEHLLSTNQEELALKFALHFHRASQKMSLYIENELTISLMCLMRGQGMAVAEVFQEMTTSKLCEVVIDMCETENVSYKNAKIWFKKQTRPLLQENFEIIFPRCITEQRYLKQLIFGFCTVFNETTTRNVILQKVAMLLQTPPCQEYVCIIVGAFLSQLGERESAALIEALVKVLLIRLNQRDKKLMNNKDVPTIDDDFLVLGLSLLAEMSPTPDAKREFLLSAFSLKPNNEILKILEEFKNLKNIANDLLPWTEKFIPRLRDDLIILVNTVRRPSLSWTMPWEELEASCIELMNEPQPQKPKSDTVLINLRHGVGSQSVTNDTFALTCAKEDFEQNSKKDLLNQKLYLMVNDIITNNCHEAMVLEMCLRITYSPTKKCDVPLGFNTNFMPIELDEDCLNKDVDLKSIRLKMDEFFGITKSNSRS